MPRKELVIQFIIGEAPDQARPAKRTIKAREFANLVPSDPRGSERNRIVTMEGANMLTQRYLMRAPIVGAVGDITLYPSDVFERDLEYTGVEDDTQTADGGRPAYNQDDMSDPNSATLLMFDFTELQGNVFCNVLNGDGRTFPLGATAGMQGLIASVYNELWGGEQKIPAGGVSITSGPRVGGYGV